MAGEKACKIGISTKSATRSVDIHHADTCTKRLRKCKQNIDRRTKPSLQSLIAAPGFVELVDLVLEYGQNCRGGVAFIELGSKRMRGETLFSFFLYSLRAFSKMELKLEVDIVGAGGLEDGPGVGG